MEKTENKCFASEEHPSVVLRNLAKEWGVDLESEGFANKMDIQDPLREFRDKFCYPKMKDLPYADLKKVLPDDDCIYLNGNSLGLKPKSADAKMIEVLNAWGTLAAYSHFHGPFPAAFCDTYGVETTAKVIGALPSEVAILNSLTVNLHFMLSAFYRPKAPGLGRYKILIEENTFPSDRYAVVSQLQNHDQDINDALIIVKSRKGQEYYIHTDDVIKEIQKHGKELAVVLLMGVHYYTGQLMDIAAITKAAHKEGCIIGWDLAHAIGNVELKMHDWDADFGIWCTYKYLNSGAGGVGGLFIHSRNIDSREVKALHGWWSNKAETRFKMAHHLEPAMGASSFKISCPSPWNSILNIASLEIFEEATMKRLIEKQKLLTGYLELLLTKEFKIHGWSIITPKNLEERGCQLSIKIPPGTLETAAKHLHSFGVVFDVRYPDVIRVAPVPLYNSYSDVQKFTKVMSSILSKFSISS